ncbi:hypothetical protein JCM10212_002066 [Sporobolomyces blumeae]
MTASVLATLSKAVATLDCSKVLSLLNGLELRRQETNVYVLGLLLNSTGTPSPGESTVPLEPWELDYLKKVDRAVDEGALCFWAVDLGWRRYHVESLFLAPDLALERIFAALSTYFTSPITPYTAAGPSLEPGLAAIESFGEYYRQIARDFETTGREPTPVGGLHRTVVIDVETLRELTEQWAEAVEKTDERVQFIRSRCGRLDPLASTQSGGGPGPPSLDSQDSLPTPSPSSDDRIVSQALLDTRNDRPSRSAVPGHDRDGEAPQQGKKRKRDRRDEGNERESHSPARTDSAPARRTASAEPSPAAESAHLDVPVPMRIDEPEPVKDTDPAPARTTRSSSRQAPNRHLSPHPSPRPAPRSPSPARPTRVTRSASRALSNSPVPPPRPEAHLVAPADPASPARSRNGRSQSRGMSRSPRLERDPRKKVEQKTSASTLDVPIFPEEAFDASQFPAPASNPIYLEPTVVPPSSSPVHDIGPTQCSRRSISRTVSPTPLGRVPPPGLLDKIRKGARRHQAKLEKARRSSGFAISMMELETEDLPRAESPGIANEGQERQCTVEVEQGQGEIPNGVDAVGNGQALAAIPSEILMPPPPSATRAKTSEHGPPGPLVENPSVASADKAVEQNAPSTIASSSSPPPPQPATAEPADPDRLDAPRTSTPNLPIPPGPPDEVEEGEPSTLKSSQDFPTPAQAHDHPPRPEIEPPSSSAPSVRDELALATQNQGSDQIESQPSISSREASAPLADDVRELRPEAPLEACPAPEPDPSTETSASNESNPSRPYSKVLVPDTSAESSGSSGLTHDPIAADAVSTTEPDDKRAGTLADPLVAPATGKHQLASPSAKRARTASPAVETAVRAHSIPIADRPDGSSSSSQPIQTQAFPPSFGSTTFSSFEEGQRVDAPTRDEAKTTLVAREGEAEPVQQELEGLQALVREDEGESQESSGLTYLSHDEMERRDAAAARNAPTKTVVAVEMDVEMELEPVAPTEVAPVERTKRDALADNEGNAIGGYDDLDDMLSQALLPSSPIVAGGPLQAVMAEGELGELVDGDFDHVVLGSTGDVVDHAAKAMRDVPDLPLSTATQGVERRRSFGELDGAASSSPPKDVEYDLDEE